ncbi:MAG: hypothetical protein JWQ96_1431 [Segetibacter sp.]|nr:hypothetical protein [Segetibacter sp.]
MKSLNSITGIHKHLQLRRSSFIGRIPIWLLRNSENKSPYTTFLQPDPPTIKLRFVTHLYC